jgi:hypothetical protein
MEFPADCQLHCLSLVGGSHKVGCLENLGALNSQSWGNPVDGAVRRLMGQFGLN